MGGLIEASMPPKETQRRAPALLGCLHPAPRFGGGGFTVHAADSRARPSRSGRLSPAQAACGDLLRLRLRCALGRPDPPRLTGLPVKATVERERLGLAQGDAGKVRVMGIQQVVKFPEGHYAGHAKDRGAAGGNPRIAE